MNQRRKTSLPFQGKPKPTYPEPENWLQIDSILCKEYGLRPWELDELTITECSWMLLALRDQEEEKLTLAAGQDASTMRLQQERMRAVMEKHLAYAQLSPLEKLALAEKQYR